MTRPAETSPLGDFGRVPAEVRCMIWRHAVQDVYDSRGRLCWPNVAPNGRHRLALLRTCRTIHQEAAEQVYRGRHFTIWLGTVDGRSEQWRKYLKTHRAGALGDNMPGFSGADSPTSWWHWIDRLDITLSPPPSRPRDEDGRISETRRMELMAMRVDVWRLVQSLGASQKLGLPNLTIHLLESRKPFETWLEDHRSQPPGQPDLVGAPARTHPWSDIELTLAPFTVLRNVKSVDIRMPTYGVFKPTVFSFDQPQPLSETMMQKTDDDFTVSVEEGSNITLAAMEEYCIKCITRYEGPKSAISYKSRPGIHWPSAPWNGLTQPQLVDAAVAQVRSSLCNGLAPVVQPRLWSVHT